MYAFGREPLLPGELLSEPNSVELQSNTDAESAVQYVIGLGAKRFKSCIDFENNSHVPRAMVRVGWAWKDPREVGMTVAHWRDEREARLATGR